MNWLDSEPTTALVDGPSLRTMLERMRVGSAVDKILEKRRDEPRIRIDEYIAAQKSETVRTSLEWLMRNREWVYVSFAEFLRQLRDMAQRLIKSVVQRKGPVCFVVDSVSKSSFWVLALVMHLVPDAQRLLDDGRAYLAVDNSGGNGGLSSAFSKLPHLQSTTLVVLDDAAYSGEQLASFIYNVVKQWRFAVGGKTSRPPHLTVGVPFVTESAYRLLQKHSDAIHTSVHVRGLFNRRTVESVLASDLFLSRRGGMLFTEYRSLYFDVLGLRPTNTLLVFEHKIADGLSIPHRWLQTGPFVPPGVQAAYRVRQTHVSRIAAMLKREIKEQRSIDVIQGSLDRIAAKETYHRDVARRVAELMHTPAFRNEFMERIDMDVGDLPAKPQYMPLLPPEFCTPRYRQYVRLHAHNLGGEAYAYMPDCRRPPYKRGSFRGRVALPI